MSWSALWTLLKCLTGQHLYFSVYRVQFEPNGRGNPTGGWDTHCIHCGRADRR